MMLVEGWPEERFMKQWERVQAESVLRRVKNTIKEMKASMVRKGKEHQNERVDKIIRLLGIDYNLALP